VVDLFSERRLNHHAAVQGGVLADESSSVLKEFFEARR
jgi:tRNA(adenine34) deaminase